MGWREPSLYPSAAHPHSTLAAVGAGSGGSLVCSPDLLGGVRRWQRRGYIHRAVLAGTAGASLAVLRGWGSLSVFLLLLLHLLYDFPDLALCSLGGRGGARTRGQGGHRKQPEQLFPPSHNTASHRSAPSKLLITEQAGSLAQL